MNGRKAKAARRKIWGPRKDWDFEGGFHPRTRNYVVTENLTTPMVKVDNKTGKLIEVEFEYYGPIIEADRKDYQHAKRRSCR